MGLSTTFTLTTAAGAVVAVTTFDVLDGRIGVLKVSEGKVSYLAAAQKVGATVLPTIDFLLGFFARSCVINNYTNHYIYQPSAGAWVPPYRVGVVISIGGTQRGQLSFQDPPGVTSPLAIPGQIIDATFTEDVLQIAGGTAFAGP